MTALLKPPLDDSFSPLAVFYREFVRAAQSEATTPIVIEISNENNSRLFETVVFSEGHDKENFRYVERLVKTLLWICGGDRVAICGSKAVYEHISKVYCANGERSFDAEFMKKVYGDFSVCDTLSSISQSKRTAAKKNTSGCAIGLDVGGTSRKVCAMVDGKTVFSGNYPWLPKESTTPEYHYNGIKEAIEMASQHLPRIDRLGISTAGICSANRVLISALFDSLPDSVRVKASNVYIDVCTDLGIGSFCVVNDGETAAFSAAAEGDGNAVLGLSLGTSLGGGYVDKNGHISLGIDELAFVPIACDENAALDSWSGDAGCGVQYLSSEAVLRLAQISGIRFNSSYTMREKIQEVAALLNDGDERAHMIYETMGIYLGYAISLYSLFYDISFVKIMGGITSGRAGEIMCRFAQKVLLSENKSYIKLLMPGGEQRAFSQAAAAAMLP